MVTTWPPTLPILQDSAKLVAKWVEEMSEGRMKITVYGGGELIPSLEVFEAVTQGVAEMGHGASYYWAGKAPAAQFFGSVPFGMNAQQMISWLYSGGGLQLWEELYAPLNLVPMPVGNTGPQMGGWFKREINSPSDLQGLKMRIPGLGGDVIKRAGGSAILSALGEIYTNLERGVIDAAEWIGPYHDYLQGFHKAAEYYYYPGWQEPQTVTELMINKSAFDALPPYLQNIIRTAAASNQPTKPCSDRKTPPPTLSGSPASPRSWLRSSSDELARTPKPQLPMREPLTITKAPSRSSLTPRRLPITTSRWRKRVRRASPTNAVITSRR